MTEREMILHLYGLIMALPCTEIQTSGAPCLGCNLPGAIHDYVDNAERQEDDEE